MNKALLFFSVFFLCFSFCFITVAADDFFKIKTISFSDKQPKKEPFPYREVPKPGTTKKDRIFLPYVEATVRVQEQIAALNIYAKAYFYDKDKKLLATVKPHPVNRGDGPCAVPAFLPKAKDLGLFFPMPPEILNSSDWHVLIVFGDKNAAVAAVYPRGSLMPKAFSFPEKNIVEKPAAVEREKAVNPLIEYVTKTSLKEYPQFTLFLRCPVGAKDFSETKGVLALCVLANGVAEIKRRLQEADVKDELSGPLRFAEKNKLAILCWGSRRLWNPRFNWDELKRSDENKIDRDFDIVAKAWADAIEKLSSKYGFPNRNFLLWGSCGSAQYSARLALRQPKYFLAVRVHMPGSFDEPTIEANKILWCLTTGEDEGGYERTLKFLAVCRERGYPIIYKAIPGLGHAGHPLTEKLGLEFFEYAWSLHDEKEEFTRDLSKTFTETSRNRAKNPYQPWPKSFKNPEYVGDVYRQTIYPADQVPAEPGIRIPLPTKKLADAWFGDGQFAIDKR